MNITVLALASLLYIVFSGLPVTPSVSGSAGASITDQRDFDSAAGAAGSLNIVLELGDERGPVLRYGISHQAATAFTDDWYRYRGFTGLTMGAGYYHDFGSVATYALGGGQLAKYENSYSYFWFPFIELGGSMPVGVLGDRLGVAAGLAIPVYLRADAITFGASATVSLSLLPSARGRK